MLNSGLKTGSSAVSSSASDMYPVLSDLISVLPLKILTCGEGGKCEGASIQMS